MLCGSHGHYKRAFESLVQLSVDLEEDFLLKAVDAGLDAARIGLYHHLDMHKVGNRRLTCSRISHLLFDKVEQQLDRLHNLINEHLEVSFQDRFQFLRGLFAFYEARTSRSGLTFQQSLKRAHDHLNK